MRINEVHFHVFIFSAVKEVIYMAQPLTSFHSSLICAIRNSIIAVDVINKTFAYEYRFQFIVIAHAQFFFAFFPSSLGLFSIEHEKIPQQKKDASINPISERT